MGIILRGLPAFLMSRICERGARNFGRESKRGEIYAAAVVGLMLLILVLSATLVLNAFLPGLLKTLKLSKLGVVLIWIAATLITYVVFIPNGRYRKWSDDFRRRHELARNQPGFAEVLAIATLFALLMASIGLN